MLVIFVYLLLFFRPSWPQVSNRADFSDVTAQLLTWVGGFEKNNQDLPLFMCEFVECSCACSRSSKQDLSHSEPVLI